MYFDPEWIKADNHPMDTVYDLDPKHARLGEASMILKGWALVWWRDLCTGLEKGTLKDIAALKDLDAIATPTAIIDTFERFRSWGLITVYTDDESFTIDDTKLWNSGSRTPPPVKAKESHQGKMRRKREHR